MSVINIHVVVVVRRRGSVAIDMSAICSRSRRGLSQRLLSSNGSKDRELTAAAGPLDFQIADGGIVDQSGGRDIFVSALASLERGAEAPAVGFAIVGDGDAVIAARSHVFDGA